MLLLGGCASAAMPPTPGPATGVPSAAPSVSIQAVATARVDPTPLPVEYASDFTLTTLAGEPITLSAVRGRTVLINFWATWCLPCRAEMPYLEALAARYPEQLTVLAINMREDAATVQPFVDEVGVTFPILLHPDNETLLNYGVSGLPLSFVVNPDGVLRLRRMGPLTPVTMDAWLAAELGRG